MVDLIIQYVLIASVPWHVLVLAALLFLRYHLFADLALVGMVADLFYCGLGYLVTRHYCELMRLINFWRRIAFCFTLL